ncbi:dTDP-4-amino-4,6-dideoxygalactose transaminase [Fodinibius roseus]|uniref:dTDP-4-amino-4,6-dideoxygalactose transaminase n=1 Tax=Fodinibius roseus TaxID=1194090 RepID=A0A1M4TNU7_9BACT|nr:DegT/DnrJ/EryC1/StrS family aminotransferase [Fodinibius roseus]SHE45967.1 dTDP-4-amino-4,6-dideoxygalactose transaminase [Fodinibius roseus]
MKKKKYTRREFIKQNSLAGGAFLTLGATSSLFAGGVKKSDTPAILGGPAVRSNGWPSWPIWNPETDEKQVLEVLRSGVWSRSKTVAEFEQKWAETVGAKRCLTTVNGTNALVCSLANLDIGGGDEVIVSPYTWIATIQAILQTGAMPVFADIDPETFQIDPVKIQEKITSRTKGILPVHILGLPADMIRIMEIAKKNELVVVEDACQAWLAEINNKQVGTFGDAGCFSFQNSKNIPMGEGGAIVSNDEEFMDRCYSYHNWGGQHGSVTGEADSGRWVMSGTKMRLSEYQAAIGLAQLERLEEQTLKRSTNAEYLKSQIKDIPGILPYKLYDHVTRAAFHLFPFRYKKNEFKGLARSDFLSALRAEGIPGSDGYTTLHDQSFLGHAFNSKNFQKMYPQHMLDLDSFQESNQCPVTDRICNEEAVWFSQQMLLADKSDMDDIAMAIEKIYENAEDIKNRI